MSVPYLRLYIKRIKTFSSTFNRLFPYKIACAQQNQPAYPRSLIIIFHDRMQKLWLFHVQRAAKSWDCTGVHAELSLWLADSRFFSFFFFFFFFIMRRLTLYLNCRGRQTSQNTRKGQNNHKTYTNMSDKNLKWDPLRAMKTFIRRKVGHTT